MSSPATIVVPTYKEVENLEPLIRRVFEALGNDQRNKTTEMIIVDDNSNDGSEELVNRLRESEGYNVRIIVRTKERGLSSAVMRGFDEAKGEIVLCMDADLQHPPERVPALLETIDPRGEKKAEFVIGTRYGGGENSIDKDWPLYRRVLSGGARVLARPLSSMSDPMTGFFGLPVSVLKKGGRGVNTLGFKIGLELFVKCRVERHSEVPIVFGVRNAGYSKLTGRVIVHYLIHLVHLYWFQYPWLVLLLLFGGVGVLVAFLALVFGFLSF